MKRLIQTTLILLIPLFSYAQKESFHLLPNHVYQEIDNPDEIYEWEELNKYNINDFYVRAEFPLPDINSDTIIFRYATFKLNKTQSSKQLYFYPYGFWKYGSIALGSIRPGLNSKVKVKHLRDGNIPTACLVEVSDLYFDKYINYKFDFQMVFYRNGRVEVRYGENNFEEDFPGYNNMFSGVYTYDRFDHDYSVPLWVTESFENPRLIDLNDNIPNEDSIDGFPKIPNKEFAFYIDLEEFSTATGIGEKNKNTQLNWQVNQNHLEISFPKHDNNHVEIWNLMGQQLLDKETNEISLQIPLDDFNDDVIIISLESGSITKTDKLVIIR